MSALGLTAFIVAAPVIAIFAIFINEVILGLFPLGGKHAPGAGQPNIAILIPAHNEASGIVTMLTSLRELIPASAHILVVADNCSDDTAVRARQCGVAVIEREDQAKRGKGYALDFGRAHLAKSAPECVVILDADCLPEPGSIENLVFAAMSSGQPAQSVNLMKPGPVAGPMVEISNFAFLIKNLIRQRGLVRSGGPAILTGTGMAFPWPIFETILLASADIVEDLAITVHLTRDAFTPVLVESAHVWSEAAAPQDTLTQRTRWEHGFIGTAAKHGLPSIATGIAKRHLALVRLGLHLLVPPLAMLFALGFLVVAALISLALAGGGFVPAGILLATMLLSVVLVAIAWWRDGRSLLSASAIWRIPFYILWKIPVYLKLAKGAETEWVRTGRQDSSSS
jgi:cellulose synthase/poly-beta-1,6-N-acetylglucosamine synthase-like glycosyltransferase